MNENNSNKKSNENSYFLNSNEISDENKKNINDKINFINLDSYFNKLKWGKLNFKVP